MSTSGKVRTVSRRINMVATKRCAYGECRNDSRFPHRWKTNKDGDNIIFYHFPGPIRHRYQRELWIKACHRGDNFKCNKDSYICSLHFVGEKGPTKQYPNPISAIASKEKVEELHSCKRRLSLDEKRDKAKKICDEKAVIDSLLQLSSALASQGKTSDEMVVANTLVSLVDSVEETPTCAVEDTVEDAVDSTNDFLYINEENDIQTWITAGTQTETYTMKHLFMEKIENPRKTRHYTGMEKECLDFIFEQIKDKGSRMHTWKGIKRTKRHKTHDKYLKMKNAFSKLTTREQFIFTLVKLRRNPSLEMLCDIFDISTGVGSRIFTTWVLFLEKELDFLLYFPSTSELQGVPIPKDLQEIKNLRAIIDGTEFFIEKPSLPSSQRATYSQYKSHNTFKLLISISPVPHINYVSTLFSGSISDKEIVEKCGFLEKLNPGDVVMTDKGFNIRDLLALRESKQSAPPVMRKNNIPAEASTATRRVATTRVHIERMIRRIKAFGIVKGTLPLTYKPYLSSIVKVIAILVNLQSNIIDTEE